MLGSAVVSGVFGMAGGLLLAGVLLSVMPVPAAMALHALTQLSSNVWRAVLWRRYVRWGSVAPYAGGCLLALGAWSLTNWVPDRAVALLMLGVTPFLARLLPGSFRPDPTSRVQGAAYGGVSMSLLLMTGVSGPLIDTFFLGGTLDRRQIVATKAACQVFGHAMKLAYFGAIIDQAAALDPLLAALGIVCSVAGTTLARGLLEALTDVQYRSWANRIVTTIAVVFIVQGGALLLR
jgi:uncharacterized protein